MVAPANSGYPGCLMLEVPPWRLYHQLGNPNRMILVAIALERRT